jgi:hypothetical protein
MRSFVPALYTVLAMSVSSPLSAFADSLSCSSLKKACAEASLSADICARASSTFQVEWSSGQTGCQYTPPSLKGVTAANVAEAVNMNMRATPWHGYGGANTCCGDSTACATQLRDAMATDAKNKLSAVVGANKDKTNGGINGSHSTNSTLLGAQAAVASSAAGACFARKELCRTTYNSWAKDIESANCGKACADQAARLRGEAQRCDGLSVDKMKGEVERLLADKGTSDQGDNNSQSDTNLGPVDETAEGGAGSGLNPQALMGMLSGLLQQQQQQPEESEDPIMDCSNEAIAGCQPQAAKNSWNSDTSGANMQTSNDSTGGFNVAPGGVDGLNPQAVLPPGGSGQAQATSAGVPNGGTPMPGGGAAASLGGVGPGGQVPGGSGRSTDIMHGERSGGFAQTNAAMTMTPGGSGGFSGYGHGDSYDANVDLAQFLPKDPARVLAGGQMRAAAPQINTSSVNIWNRISEHIKARCTQGLLRDCVP